MKKIFLLIAVFTTVLMLSRCEQKIDGNAYVLKGKIGIDLPAKVYLVSRNATGEQRDSAVVKNKTFEFKGEVTKPFAATLLVNYDTTTGFSKTLADRVGLFIEQGKITLKSNDSIKNAVISSPVNDDSRAWSETVKPLQTSKSKLDEEERAMLQNATLSPEEKSAQIKVLETKQDSISKNIKQLVLDFIKAQPDSYYALSILFNLATGYYPDGDEAQEIFDMFSERLKASVLGNEIKERIAKWKATSIGNIAPDFTQNDSTGNPVKLSDFRGKYLLLDFWASWCSSCRYENPNVVKAYQMFKDMDFTILGVSLDSGDGTAWRQAIVKDKLEWSHVSDLKGWKNDAAVLYGIRAIPSNFLLDREGKIIAKNLHGKALEETIGKYVTKNEE